MCRSRGLPFLAFDGVLTRTGPPRVLPKPSKRQLGGRKRSKRTPAPTTAGHFSSNLQLYLKVLFYCDWRKSRRQCLSFVNKSKLGNPAVLRPRRLFIIIALFLIPWLYAASKVLIQFLSQVFNLNWSPRGEILFSEACISILQHHGKRKAKWKGSARKVLVLFTQAREHAPVIHTYIAR